MGYCSIMVVWYWVPPTLGCGGMVLYELVNFSEAKDSIHLSSPLFPIPLSLFPKRYRCSLLRAKTAIGLPGLNSPCRNRKYWPGYTRL